MRRYDEPIEVRTAAGPGLLAGDPDGSDLGGSDPDGRTPVAFVWRDRLYVVREVQTHWYERRVWWREAAASALLGLRSDVRVDALGGSARATVTTPVAERRTPLEPAECEVWRVEAAAGRCSPVGVYDLVRDPALDGPGTWRLARLDD